MNKPTTIQIEQIKQEIDLLIAQLVAFRTSVIALGDKVKPFTPASVSGILDDAQVAALLNKRERTIQKRMERLQNKS